LQNLLDNKEQQAFWKVWKSSFGSKNKQSSCVEGQSDNLNIANLFAESFCSIQTSQTSDNASQSVAYSTLMARLKSYTGALCNYDSIISVDVIEKYVNDFRCGKAAGFDHLTAEHLKFCHPLVICILKLLFSLMVF